MPPGAISPSIMLTIGTPPPSGVNESCIESTAPVEVRVVAFAKSAEEGTPKRTSLPSIAAPAAWSAAPAWRASKVVTRLSETTKITAIAERIAQPWRRSPSRLPKVRGSENGIRSRSEISSRLRERVGVLERVRRVGVVEAAAVGAELLDRLLAGHRTAREVLGGAGDGRDGVRVGEVLHGAGGDQQDRRHHAEREQDAHAAADQVDPEVADPVGARAGEAADERHRDGHPDGRRREVLHRQAGHLHQVAHGRLAGVVLPVRVAHERRRRVPGQVRLHTVEAERERQQVLDALQAEQEQHRRQREAQHRQGVGRPGLVCVRVDPAQAVEHPLRAPVGGRRVDAGQVVAERDVRDAQDHDEREDGQQPGGRVAHQNRSGKSRATTR